MCLFFLSVRYVCMNGGRQQEVGLMCDEGEANGRGMISCAEVIFGSGVNDGRLCIWTALADT